MIYWRNSDRSTTVTLTQSLKMRNTVPTSSLRSPKSNLEQVTTARRVSSLSENLTDRDLATCRCFSIQCDESVDSASTAQLMIFIRDSLRIAASNYSPDYDTLVSRMHRAITETILSLINWNNIKLNVAQNVKCSERT